jgi:hypothetical protein
LGAWVAGGHESRDELGTKQAEGASNRDNYNAPRQARGHSPRSLDERHVVAFQWPEAMSPSTSSGLSKPKARRMAPEVGFEPTTNRLTADRSTTELLWNHVSVGSTESRPTEEIWLRGLPRPGGERPLPTASIRISAARSTDRNRFHLSVFSNSIRVVEHRSVPKDHSARTAATALFSASKALVRNCAVGRAEEHFQ